MILSECDLRQLGLNNFSLLSPIRASSLLLAEKYNRLVLGGLNSLEGTA